MAVAVEPRAAQSATAVQRPWIGNGNEAVARAIIDIGYDAEGYYPITPSSDAGEAVSKAFANGETDIAFIVGTSELAALGKEIDAKAGPEAERLETAMTEDRDGSWVDDFWAFRAEFGFASAAESCLATYARLRQAQDPPAEQLFSEIQSEPDEGLRRAKLRELVDKYRASKWYRLARRLLDGMEPWPAPDFRPAARAEAVRGLTPARAPARCSLQLIETG